MILIIYFYLLYGIYNSNELSRIYIIILSFISFKIIINYRKCSLSYIECLVRNIKKEDGYINQFFESLIDVRYTDHIYIILSISFMILYYDLIILNHIQEIRHYFKNELICNQ